jgi:hypothetical protein
MPIDSEIVPAINILPSDTHGDILVQLIRGQERAATELRLQNERLFGGNGQPGAIYRIVQQHEDLAQKIDDTKSDLIKKIDEVAIAAIAKAKAVEDAQGIKNTEFTDKIHAIDNKSVFVAGIGTSIAIGVGWFISWFKHG